MGLWLVKKDAKSADEDVKSVPTQAFRRPGWRAPKVISSKLDVRKHV